jgi:hypothetical protein
MYYVGWTDDFVLSYASTHLPLFYISFARFIIPVNLANNIIPSAI